MAPVALRTILQNRSLSASTHTTISHNFLRAFSSNASTGKVLQLGVDEEICSRVQLRPVEDIAWQLGLKKEKLIPYGHNKAKIRVFEPVPGSTSMTNTFENCPQRGKLVLVTAMSPTKAGEGKTTTSVGLVDGINLILRKEGKANKKIACAALREPSLGPVFGMKGGGAGGGHAQVAPMDEINLHFTGDLHAITSAHNLLSALIDNHVYFKKSPEIDVRRISWKRVMDMNERALRNVIVGLGGASNGYPRHDGFDITVASEVMAILCLSENLTDLERRLSQIIIGYTRANGKENPSKPITAGDINAAMAMTALLKDAMQPNLVQTLEHSPAILHGGPFANIAHGCNSIIATKLAMKLSDYVVTEAGFGADLGAEKFLDIKCRFGDLKPDLVTLVVTCRAAKLHGGTLYKDLLKEDLVTMEKGLENVKRHCENMQKFNLPIILAINKFPTDTAAEEQFMMENCKNMPGVIDCVVSDHWSNGGAGAENMARSVMNFLDTKAVSKEENPFKHLYEAKGVSLQDKIKTVATEIYRATDIVYNGDSAEKLAKFTKEGYGDLPICIAKTQYSFSDNAALLNAPSNHAFNVSDVRLSAGAEFVVVISGSIMTMPGLPKIPSAEAVGITEGGLISVEGKWVSPEDAAQTKAKNDAEKPKTVAASEAAYADIIGRKNKGDPSPGGALGQTDVSGSSAATNGEVPTAPPVKVKVNIDDPKIISGTKLSKVILEEIKQEVQQLKVERNGQVPGLGVVMVGARPDSATYVMSKQKLAKESGFITKSELLPENSTEEEVLAAVMKLNNDPEIHGILAQLPMPDHIDGDRIVNAIEDTKDVDGFSAKNMGKAALKGGKPWAVSCTPLGVMEMLKRYNVEVKGKKCVVIGRSNIVGMPLTLLLHHANGTVTMCHSHTKDIKEVVSDADIVCAAIGKPLWLKGDWLKPGAVVVDVGINQIEDATRKSGHRLVGDVDFDSCYPVASQITPVPGGVGPMTVTMLMQNTLNLFKQSKQKRQKMVKTFSVV